MLKLSWPHILIFKKNFFIYSYIYLYTATYLNTKMKIFNFPIISLKLEGSKSQVESPFSSFSVFFLSSSSNEDEKLCFKIQNSSFFD